MAFSGNTSVSVACKMISTLVESSEHVEVLSLQHIAGVPTCINVVHYLGYDEVV